MNLSPHKLVLVVALLLVAFTSESAAEALKNIAARPHHAPPGTSLEEISDSIVQAADEQRWFVVGRTDNTLTVSINVRGKHDATVSIGFDDQNFWIDYVDSKNLDYSAKDRKIRRQGKTRITSKGPRIHKNYNRWVELLAERIASRVKHPMPPARQREEQPQPLLIADEIRKLDELRDEGILTNEEFESQKAKLIGR